MPQPPNLQKMLQQAQEMMAAQQEAQETLKDERVEATAGGGMVKVVMTGDMRLQSLTIDPDAVDPEDVEMLQDLVVAAVNEALRSAEELAESKLGGAARRLRPDERARRARARRRRRRRLAAPGRGGMPPAAATARRDAAEEARLLAPPLQRLVTELGKLPGIGQRHRAAARVPHPARVRRGRERARRRDPRRQGEDHAVRGLLQPRRRAALRRSAWTSGATPS